MWNTGIIMNMAAHNPYKYTDQGLLFLRLCLGVIFVFHGYPKFMAGRETWALVGSAMSNLGITFYPEIWGLLAALAELAGGVCLLLGLLFRPVCLVLAFTMAVAFSMHFLKGDPFQISSHSLTAGIVFVALFFTGPGSYIVSNNPTTGSGD